ncbi:MAG: glycoside hydrolase family 88 protein [Lachnospiraceae bacterium]|nr:glycoside hydrolase family 88 protein [Lachnospiraceae bacterium]
MIQRQIILEHPERFSGSYEISKQKIDMAIEKALNKLESNIPEWTDCFPGTSSVDYKYVPGTNNNWECGMRTGTYWLAYELSGNPKFREVAEKQLATYKDRFEHKVGLSDHDVGFVYTPSCVAAYKVTGDEHIRRLALEVADYYYRTSYTKEGGFILRGWTWQEQMGGCRTMMDTLMNASFLFWAGQECGRQEYTEAALSQNKMTEKYLIREDGSSFHHYQFELGTYKPLYGLTLQGYSNDSCWSRGHAWGVYGFPIAYSYTKEPFLLEVYKEITYYMLNHLPKDMLPYWDYTFTEGEEPRDSSAAVINACGMLEMCKYLPDTAPEKQIYQNAAAQLVEAVIDRCTGDIGRDYDGLICHVTHACPQKIGIDECAVYGDYFYLEALLRMVKPEWNRYW